MAGLQEHANSVPGHRAGHIQKICKYFRVYFHELAHPGEVSNRLHNSSQDDEIVMGSWTNGSRRINLLQERHTMG